MDNKAEEIRIRYLYRDLVLRGKITLPLEGARALVGPDCAYHLYSLRNFGGGESCTDGQEKACND